MEGGRAVFIEVFNHLSASRLVALRLLLYPLLQADSPKSSNMKLRVHDPLLDKMQFLSEGKTPYR